MMQQKEYLMYSSIMEQPHAIESLLNSTNENYNNAASVMRNSENVFIVGTGSSLHAALMGRYFFEKYAGFRNVKVFSSFEFSNYTPMLSSKDAVIVISHRGYKMYSYDSLAKARKAGCMTVAITGISSSIKKGDADFIFTTVDQEKSSAHTISLTGALAVMLRLALSSGEENPDRSMKRFSQSITSAMKETLKLESSIEKLSGDFDFSHRIWICGGGPNAVTAMEAALKMQETSYVTAYGYEVEQMIHGPVRSADLSKDLFICISTSGKSVERVQDFVKTLLALNSNIIEISSIGENSHTGIKNKIEVPLLEEELSPFVNLILFQLLSLSVAVKLGKNPDNFRSDDPDFSKMDELLKL